MELNIRMPLQPAVFFGFVCIQVVQNHVNLAAGVRCECYLLQQGDNARTPRQNTSRIPACICRFPPPAVLITPKVARFDIFVPGELKLGELVTLSACMFTSNRSRSR